MSSHELEQDLSHFGISDAAIQVFIALTRHGQLGIMELARQTDLGRNVVYRAIEELVEDSLVSVAYLDKSKEYLANGPDSLEQLMESRQAQLTQTRSLLPQVTAALGQLQSVTEHEKIKTYDGVQGLRYVNWNLTKAVDEFRVFEVAHLHQYLDDDFATRFREAISQKKITTYDLTNEPQVDSYLGDQEQWIERTNYRYLDPDILEIKHEIYIYNDVVALLDYSGNVPRCTEIYNHRLAEMQKQLYDTIWLGATEMDLTPDKLSRRAKQ